LERRKQTAETRQLFIEFTVEALQWLIDDGVASKVDVTAQWRAMGRLDVNISLTRPDGQIIKYDYAWNSTEQKLEVISHAL
jgi:phage gp46-like protein